MKQDDPRATIAAADQVFSAGKYDEAAAVYSRALAAAEALADHPAQVEALSMLARAQLIQGRAEQGRPFLARAAALASDQDPQGWGRYLGVRGRFEWQDQQDLPRATATFKAMYDFCVAHEQHSRAIDAAHMVAITGGEAEQLEWAQKGIAAAEAGEQTDWLGPLWNNLGWTYHERGQHDEALAALLKARHYHHLGSRELPKLIADIFVARAYRLADQVAEATAWTARAHEWAKRLYDENPADADFQERLGNTHEELGELAALQGDDQTAREHLQRALELLLSAGAEEWGVEDLGRLRQRLASLAP